MEASPRDIAECFEQIDILQAALAQREEQLRIQGDRIRELEELVTQQSDKLAEHNAPSLRSYGTPDECKKKYNEMEKRLCKLFKAIEVHGEAVKIAAREATYGLDC
jgi:chromosome segregation ATPase